MSDRMAALARRFLAGGEELCLLTLPEYAAEHGVDVEELRRAVRSCQRKPAKKKKRPSPDKATALAEAMRQLGPAWFECARTALFSLALEGHPTREAARRFEQRTLRDATSAPAPQRAALVEHFKRFPYWYRAVAEGDDVQTDAPHGQVAI